MKQYQLKKEVKERDLSSRFLLYNYKTGVLVELNESAKLIWSLFKENKSNEELVSSYAKFYKIDHNLASKDVNDVLAELESKGILERQEEP